MALLNENIRALRLQSGLSQVEFAKHFGITKQCVSNWENDNIMPSIEMLVKMADFFKVTTDQLLGRVPVELIDAGGLTAEQRAHIRQLVRDLSRANAALAARNSD